jgi:hypothetical protein
MTPPTAAADDKQCDSAPPVLAGVPQRHLTGMFPFLAGIVWFAICHSRWFADWVDTEPSGLGGIVVIILGAWGAFLAWIIGVVCALRGFRTNPHRVAVTWGLILNVLGTLAVGYLLLRVFPLVSVLGVGLFLTVPTVIILAWAFLIRVLG